MATTDFSKADIRGIREALGLTQEEFAERCGVNRTAVTHWESGLRTPGGSAAVILEQLEKQAARKTRK